MVLANFKDLALGCIQDNTPDIVIAFLHIKVCPLIERTYETPYTMVCNRYFCRRGIQCHGKPIILIDIITNNYISSGLGTNKWRIKARERAVNTILSHIPVVILAKFKTIILIFGTFLRFKDRALPDNIIFWILNKIQALSYIVCVVFSNAASVTFKYRSKRFNICKLNVILRNLINFVWKTDLLADFSCGKCINLLGFILNIAEI